MLPMEALEYVVTLMQLHACACRPAYGDWSVRHATHTGSSGKDFASDTRNSLSSLKCLHSRCNGSGKASIDASLRSDRTGGDSSLRSMSRGAPVPIFIACTCILSWTPYCMSIEPCRTTRIAWAACARQTALVGKKEPRAETCTGWRLANHDMLSLRLVLGPLFLSQ